MRELTKEELILVAGGTTLASEQGTWWSDAFNWLSDSLSWLDAAIPGWLGIYIGGFGDVAERMNDTGNLIWDRASGYNNYVIDQQSNGDPTMTFEEWSDQQDGGGG